jgi:hypothetical protein
MSSDLEWHENKALRRMEVAAPLMLAALIMVEESITEYLRDRAEAAADGGIRSDWDFGEEHGGSIDVIRDAIKAATGEA